MLNADQIDKLKVLMSMAGWREVMKPVIEAKMTNNKNLAFLLPSERPEPYSKLDDATATAILRGEVKNAEWMLHAFENEIIVFEANRRREELAQPDRPANPV